MIPTAFWCHPDDRGPKILFIKMENPSEDDIREELRANGLDDGEVSIIGRTMLPTSCNWTRLK